jgi:hypothetical protein
VSGACSTALTFQLARPWRQPRQRRTKHVDLDFWFGHGTTVSRVRLVRAPRFRRPKHFTAGTNTKTYYSTRQQRRRSYCDRDRSVDGLDDRNFESSTSCRTRFRCLAESSPGVPLSVVAGQCSTAMYVTPAGENGVAAPLFAPTTTVRNDRGRWLASRNLHGRRLYEPGKSAGKHQPSRDSRWLVCDSSLHQR